MKLGAWVHVQWIDSTAHYRWVTVADLGSGPDPCESIGWLVRDEKDFITVAGHRSPGTDSFTGAITIPRAAVRSIKKIGGKH